MPKYFSLASILFGLATQCVSVQAQESITLVCSVQQWCTNGRPCASGPNDYSYTLDLKNRRMLDHYNDKRFDITSVSEENISVWRENEQYPSRSFEMRFNRITAELRSFRNDTTVAEGQCKRKSREF